MKKGSYWRQIILMFSVCLGLGLQSLSAQEFAPLPLTLQRGERQVTFPIGTKMRIMDSQGAQIGSGLFRGIHNDRLVIEGKNRQIIPTKHIHKLIIGSTMTVRSHIMRGLKWGVYTSAAWTAFVFLRDEKPIGKKSSWTSFEAGIGTIIIVPTMTVLGLLSGINNNILARSYSLDDGGWEIVPN